METKKDPICGMDVDLNEADKKGLSVDNNFFCSRQCLDKFKGKKENHFTEILLSFILVAVAVTVFLTGYMLAFMGVVFLILATLKLIDIKGFSNMFSQYDLIAAKSRAYSVVYPFIELILGIMFFLGFQIIYAAGITVFIMGVGSIGVGKNIFSKDKVRCACLGAKIKVPLTRFTLVEDLVMFVMGVMILLGI